MVPEATRFCRSLSSRFGPTLGLLPALLAPADLRGLADRSRSALSFLLSFSLSSLRLEVARSSLLLLLLGSSYSTWIVCLKPSAGFFGGLFVATSGRGGLTTAAGSRVPSILGRLSRSAGALFAGTPALFGPTGIENGSSSSIGIATGLGTKPFLPALAAVDPLMAGAEVGGVGIPGEAVDAYDWSKEVSYRYSG